MSDLVYLPPLGALSVLPRELRDIVYNELCSATYALNAGANELFSEAQKWCEWSEEEGWCGENEENLSILQVCKALRDEFMCVLFKKASFEIDLYRCDGYQINSLDLPFLNDIRNVAFAFDILPSQELCTMRADPVSYFTDTSISRDTCLINIHECSPSMTLILHSPFMQTLGQLTAFKTVRLVFTSSAVYWESARGSRPTCWGFDTMVECVSYALKPTLGPCATGGEPGEPTWWTQYATFHPQRYQVEKAKSLEAGSGTHGFTEISDD